MKKAWTVAASAAVAALIVAGTATSKEKDEEPKELKRYAATGETELCLRTTKIRSSQVLDNQHILFKMNNGDTYLNKLPRKCSQLGFNRAFSYKNNTSELCNTEIIRVLNTSAAGGPTTLATCGIGKFERLEKIAKAEK